MDNLSLELIWSLYQSLNKLVRMLRETFANQDITELKLDVATIIGRSELLVDTFLPFRFVQD